MFPLAPLLLLGLGASGLGIGANMIGNRRAQDAQAAAMAAERMRDNSAQERAFDINAKSRDRYENFDQKQAKTEQGLADLFTADAAGPPLAGALPPTSSNITVANEAEETATAKKATDQQGKARARLMAFGNTFGDADRGMSRDASELAGIAGERRGSMAVLPMELDAAMQEGSGWRLAGDILGGVGSIATMGGLSGAQIPFLAGLGGGGPLAGTSMLARQQSPLLSLFSRG